MLNIKLKRSKGGHSVWTIQVNKDLLPMKTGLRDVTLYILFKLTKINLPWVYPGTKIFNVIIHH